MQNESGNNSKREKNEDQQHINMKNYFIEQIVNRILEMTPDQLENIKTFFGIQDFDLDLVTGTESVYGTVSKISTDINTNDLDDLNSDQEDEKLEYLAHKLKDEVNHKNKLNKEIKMLKKFKD